MEKMALIEISDQDLDEFTELMNESDLKPKIEGKSSGLDGMSIIRYSLELIPVVLPIIELLLKRWLERRKMIKLKIGKTIIETDSIDDLQRVVNALNT